MKEATACAEWVLLGWKKEGGAREKPWNGKTFWKEVFMKLWQVFLLLKLFFDVLRPGLFSECEAASSTQHMCGGKALKRLAFSYISNNFSKASSSYTIFHPISGQLDRREKNLEERGKLQKVSILKIWEKEELLYFYRTLYSAQLCKKKLFTQTTAGSKIE